ncbi:MAG: hypothetical protein ACMUIP_08895, partial [bacterium]
MSYKRLLSLITLVLFIVAVSCTCRLAIARMNELEDEIVVGERVDEQMKDDDGMTDEADVMRNAAIYQHDSTVSPYGATYQQWSYAPDIGYGEVGEGFSYVNPLTGESVSYQVTGIGMGAIPLPVYGGMGSQYGQASYGMFSTGSIPVVPSTPGVYSETSTAGSAFGEGYQYAASVPDPTAIVAMNLIQNPSTAGLGYAMAFASGAMSSNFSLPTSIGSFGSGLSSFGSLGGMNIMSGLGLSSGLGGFGYTGASYGVNPGLNAYSGGYIPSYGGGYASAPLAYGNAYAPSYGGGYVANPYGYQNVTTNTNTQATQ